MDIAPLPTFNTKTELTQSQLLFWIGQELTANSPLYNMVLTFELKGNIEPQHFQAAFQKLVDGSDAMRTVFELFEGKPMQKVLPAFPYTIEFLDWSKEPKDKPFVQQWIKKRTQYAFNLSECLFDTVLVKLADEDYLWYFNQHHLTTDAWSVSVIYNEMAKLYELAKVGQLNNAPQLPSFRDYIDFERVARNNPEKKAIHDYWQKKLENSPLLPHLYARKGVEPTTLSLREKLDLGLERSQRLRDLTKEKGIRSWTQHLSLYNIFSTVLFSFLYRVSGQQRLIFGSPAHNRPSSDFKNTIGLFIEIFPLLTDIEEGETFASLLKKVQVETNGFLKYAQPGAASPDLSRRFNVILNYINAAFPDFNDIPATSEWVHPDHCDPRHHLRLQVRDFDSSGSIELNFDLNANMFNARQRKDVPQHFLALLDAFIEDRTQSIDAIPIATPDEVKRLTIDFNQNKITVNHAHSILKTIEEQAQNQPEAIALVEGKTTYTYSAFNQKANQLAHYLNAKNIGEGQRVAVCLKRSPDFMVAVLGVLKSGAAFIPIPSTHPNQRVASIFEDSQAALLISDNRLTACMNMDDIPTFYINNKSAELSQLPVTNLSNTIKLDSTAYMIYTSGSTGTPKGVSIAHESLSNYINWAKNTYIGDRRPSVPLFTTVGFDLTITSIFLPLVAGGTIHIYPEVDSKADLAILNVVEENQVDFIKLTPAHLALLQGKERHDSRIQTMIVGGEDFKTSLANTTHKEFGPQLAIYNEYGPTEATVGCIASLFHANIQQLSVPIGKPISNMQAYILDNAMNVVPEGVVGELYLSGLGLAKGYWNQDEMTAQKFSSNPFDVNTRLYKTGDTARMNSEGQIEFLGRKDFQIKMDGRRIELGEIEAQISKHPKIKNCVVELVEQKKHTETAVENCTRCGLPSNYPNVEIDEEGVCELCHSFEGYQQKVQSYFKTERDLKRIFDQLKKQPKGEYDCIALLSGGKDSTYALAQLVEMGAKVLAFTLDNGYISEQAKANIRRVVDALGVDHVFGRTPAMNAIFVDSLHRYSNVCNGCFKTIYTLSIQLALEKNIPYIITGLSRGQFFETRLTEELFWNNQFDIEKIDQTILEARMAYHRTEDAVNIALGTSHIFDQDDIFERVQFLDFYRYSDVSMDEMMSYLEKKLPWERPTDTGRSTNCLINQVGIHVHKTKEGYSNYSFPYSWDVRVGDKTREGALEEINEYIDEKEVQRIMDEIGYTEINNYQQQKHLVAYFETSSEVSPAALQAFLAKSLPDYMIPTRFKALDTFPLSANGKIDRKALTALDTLAINTATEYVAPQTEFEEIMTEIWEEVINIPRIGIHDDFLEIGGSSLLAIRIMARINETFELSISLNRIFEMPTIHLLSKYIENIIVEMLAEME